MRASIGSGMLTIVTFFNNNGDNDCTLWRMLTTPTDAFTNASSFAAPESGAVT